MTKAESEFIKELAELIIFHSKVMDRAVSDKNRLTAIESFFEELSGSAEELIGEKRTKVVEDMVSN